MERTCLILINWCIVYVNIAVVYFCTTRSSASTLEPPKPSSLHCGDFNGGLFVEGSSATLYCYMEASSTISFSYWRHNGKNIETSLNGTRISTRTIEREGFKDAAITFNPILSRDSGKLEYFLHTSNGDWNHTFHLHITSRPVLNVTPLSASVELSSDLTITCNISNYDLCCRGKNYELQWYTKRFTPFPGSVVQGMPWVSYLKFRNIQKEEEGTYRCGLKNRSDVYMNVTVYVYSKDITPCAKDMDDRGTTWDVTAPGVKQIQNCLSGFSGNVTRKCSVQNGTSGRWENPNYVNCVRSEIVNIEDQLKDLESGVGNPSTVLNTAIENLYALSNTTELESGDILKSTEILSSIVDIGGRNTSVKLNQNEFVGIVDNMLSDKNMKRWNEVNEQSNTSGSVVLNIISKFGAVIGHQLDDGKYITIRKSNIDMQVHNSPTTEDLRFPVNTDMSDNYGAQIDLPKENINNQVSSVISTSAVFRTVTAILPNDTLISDKDNFVGSVVLGFSLDFNLSKKLERNVSMTFKTDSKLLVNPNIDCVFWNFSLGERGGWSTKGCHLKTSSRNLATCECNHLTNFAILMSPSTIKGSDAEALGIISIVGCSISIVGLVLTVIVHAVLWRYVKNGRSVLLVNLCVSLGLANLVFVVAVDKVQLEEVCTFITAILHYLYLVVFFTMFAKGLLIFIAVKVVFKTQSKIKLLMLLIWGVPIVIVGITVGVSYSKEYHSDTYCWLTLSNGVLYAFVAPVLFIIIANIVIIIFVLHVLYTSSSLKDKSRNKKAKAGLRSMCTLLPILGVTWAFGLLSINEDLVVFQYLFAITNSLQGLFIFIFHCFLSPQVRNAMRNRMRRYEIKSKMSGNIATIDQENRKKICMPLLDSNQLQTNTTEEI